MGFNSAYEGLMQTRAAVLKAIWSVQGILYFIWALYSAKAKGSTERVTAETQKIKITLIYLQLI